MPNSFREISFLNVLAIPLQETHTSTCIALVLERLPKIVSVRSSKTLERTGCFSDGCILVLVIGYSLDCRIPTCSTLTAFVALCRGWTLIHALYRCRGIGNHHTIYSPRPSERWVLVHVGSGYANNKIPRGVGCKAQVLRNVAVFLGWEPVHSIRGCISYGLNL